MMSKYKEILCKMCVKSHVFFVGFKNKSKVCANLTLILKMLLYVPVVWFQNGGECVFQASIEDESRRRNLSLGGSSKF